jgi:hypothetical protein
VYGSKFGRETACIPESRPYITHLRYDVTINDDEVCLLLEEETTPYKEERKEKEKWEEEERFLNFI